MAETINGLYKAEVDHRREPWRSFEAVEYATLKWADWFNNERLLEPIGNILPAEAEKNYYAIWTKPIWQLNLDQMPSGNPYAIHNFANILYKSPVGAYNLNDQTSSGPYGKSLQQPKNN